MLSNPKRDDLMWNKNKLFIEQAPEPDDVDWEFIHVSTKDKIYARIKAWALSFLFMAVCYLGIMLINNY